MVTTLDHSVKDDLLRALKNAKQDDEPVIVSHIIEVEKVNPLNFFVAGERLYLGERFFWSTPADNFTITGLGNEIIFENKLKTSERFHSIDKQWRRFKKYMTKKSIKKIGTGPLLFGGFSFDPMKEKNELWGNFPEAKLCLPTIMLTVIEDKTFLTINKLIHPFDELEKCIEHFTLYEQKFQELNNKIDCEKAHEFIIEELHKEKWLHAVKEATKNIKEKQIEKVVLAREVSLKFDDTINVYSVLKRLQEEQPTSFVFALENGSKCFIGATPERLVRKEGNSVLSTCLAGSIKRGENEREDELLGVELLTDHKNLIEHNIVVKMIIDSLQLCCSDLAVPEQPSLLKTKNIQHLYTPVKGNMKQGYSLLSIVERLHPTPALGGFPKVAAVHQIRELEPMHRGWYAAPIGWLDYNDNGEFGVAIRSGLIEDDEAVLFAGCGIVKESQPELEYMETEIKLKPMMSALGGVNNESK
ncbi:isochorismate synthase [Metabacillus fastidiosus]|uniref:isochorismate synthase n=1 Tax=Metabacillus fastidiosus TaxID=1458 RepID=UPI003D2CC0BF